MDIIGIGTKPILASFKRIVFFYLFLSKDSSVKNLTLMGGLERGDIFFVLSR